MNAITGFTLIEVMVTLAIGAILIALAIPSFRESALNNQRAASVNQMLADLGFARSQAVALRQTVTICRAANASAASPTCGNGNGWEEGWVTFVDADSDGVLDAGEEILRRQGPLIPEDEKSIAATSKLTIRGNTNVAIGVSFEPSGRGPTGTLAVCDSRNDKDEGRAIRISRGGRVRSARGNDPDDGLASCQR